MRLRRKPPVSTRRQRLQVDLIQNQPPPAFSYRSRRAPESTKPVKASKTGKFWLRRFSLAILLLLSIILTINVLTLSTTAKITSLKSSNTSLLGDQAVYQAAADHILQSSIWNRSKITIDTGKLSREMLARFPELANVNVTLPLLAHHPVVYLEPAQPALVLVNNNGSYVIDKNGKALTLIANETNFQNLPILHDQSGLLIHVNQQTLPATSVSFIEVVLAELAAKQVSVSALTLPAAASELDVQPAGQPYFAKFNLQINTPREQAGTYLATVAQLQRQNSLPAKYIDVRVEGRAYYQ